MLSPKTSFIAGGLLLAIVVLAVRCTPSSPDEAGGQGVPLTITVDQEGGGDYATVQAAFDAVPEQAAERVTIRVMNGVYDEKVMLPEGKVGVTLVGESRDSTIVTHADYSGKVVDGDTLGTSTSYTIAIDADDFTAQDITFENRYDGAQAVAVRVRGDRVAFYNVRMLGNQDTYYAHSGSSYHRDCYIEGTTDFIFGAATAVFENCEIHSKKDSYITAASTPEDQAFGFVFIDCRLTAAPGVDEVYLGRPWRDYAQTVFIDTEMGPHIRPEGWHNWSRPEAEATSLYAEHGNTGPGADRSARAAWTHELTDEEVARYTAEQILAATGQSTGEAWYAVDDGQP